MKVVEFGLRFVGVPAAAGVWASESYRVKIDMNLEAAGRFAGEMAGQGSRTWFGVSMRWDAREGDPWLICKVRALDANGMALGGWMPLCFYVAQPTDMPTDVVRFPLGGYMLRGEWVEDHGATAVLTVRRAA